MQKICVYCKKDYDKDTEHVFPVGLGGQNLYMDCVCSECNNLFSGQERELYKKSIIGLMRSIAGIEGYKKNSAKRSPFKADILLMANESNEIVYEVGQFHPMQVFIRPQIIYLNKEFYLESDSEEGVITLNKLFVKWQRTNLKLIVGGGGYMKFSLVDDDFTSQYHTEKIKTKDAILFKELPKSHELFSILTPRLYLDDDNKLLVRSRTVEESVLFVKNLLIATRDTLTLYSFGKREAIRETAINVGFAFNNFKLEQAIIKIGLNCLMYYFPQVRENPNLNKCLSFVRNGKPNVRRSLDQKSSIIDNTESTHNIFFQQAEELLLVRTSLFNGDFVFSFYIPEIRILNVGEYNRLVIDYVNHVNRFENQTDFFKSFDVRR